MVDISTDIYLMRIAFAEATDGIRREWTRPSVLFRPSLSVDGNMYCALYGPDLHSGCAGFGETPDAAMTDFDKNWREQRCHPSAVQASVPPGTWWEVEYLDVNGRWTPDGYRSGDRAAAKGTALAMSPPGRLIRCTPEDL